MAALKRAALDMSSSSGLTANQLLNLRKVPSPSRTWDLYMQNSH